jgi:hypothetical protein
MCMGTHTHTKKVEFIIHLGTKKLIIYFNSLGFALLRTTNINDNQLLVLWKLCLQTITSQISCK